MDKSFGWLNDWTFFTCMSDWVKKWICGRVASMWYIAVLICREVQHGDSPGLAAAFRHRANKKSLPAWGRRTSSQSDARARSQSKTFSHPSLAQPGFRPKCWWKKHTWLCIDWDKTAEDCRARTLAFRVWCKRRRQCSSKNKGTAWSHVNQILKITVCHRW